MSAPAISAHFTSPPIQQTRLQNGTLIVTNTQPLGEVTRCTGEWLEDWAQRAPNALFLAERDEQGAWVKLTYSEVRHLTGRLAQALINLNIPQRAPVVALSEPGIDQALLMLACAHIGQPFSTLSSAYSLQSKDFLKLGIAINKLQPGLIYASDGTAYRQAIESIDTTNVPIVVSKHGHAVANASELAELCQTNETLEVMERFNRITPDTHAKYMLTSGSTGHPKIVVNTHRMLCSNQKQIQLAWPFLKTEKPILVSWLPWSHTFGTNYNFNMVLANGGSFYFDDGKPIPGKIEQSVRNFREIQPNLFLNVPRGFDSFLEQIENDKAIARDCFARLRVVFYAGAALPSKTWQRFSQEVESVVGHKVIFSSSLGSTETAPVGTFISWLSDDPECIGLPAASMQVKLIPNAGKLEIRMKGPQIFSEYLNDPELTVAAFDEDGFYKIGDAVRLLDPHNIEKGLAFDGRVAEDFKLTSGTWVSVGSLRVKMISTLHPYAQDIVITGAGHDEVGLLIFPSEKARQTPEEIVRQHIKDALMKHKNATNSSSSLAPSRALFMKDGPSIEAGEITDKGYINQRMVLEKRANEVDRLYSSDTTDPSVISI